MSWTRTLALFLAPLTVAACSPDEPKDTLTPTGTTPTGTVTTPLSPISPTRTVLIDTRPVDPVAISFVADAAWQSIPIDPVDLGFVDCTPPDVPSAVEVPLDRPEAAQAPYLAQPTADYGAEQILLENIAGIEPVVLPTDVGDDCDALAISSQVQLAVDVAKSAVDTRIEALQGCVDRAGLAWCDTLAAIEDPQLTVVETCFDLSMDPMMPATPWESWWDASPSWCWRCKWALDRADRMARMVDLQIASCERNISALERIRDEIWQHAELGICIDERDVSQWTDDASYYLELAGRSLDQVEPRYDSVMSSLDACTPETLQVACDGCDHSLGYRNPSSSWTVSSRPALDHGVRLAEALDAAAEAPDAPPQAASWGRLADEIRALGASDVLHVVVWADTPSDEALAVLGDGALGLPKLVVVHHLPSDVPVTEEQTDLVLDPGAYDRVLEVIGAYAGPQDTGTP